MKLMIQIPCYNEENTLSFVIRSIPKKIKGIDVIETLVIDDGSQDNTVKVAKKLGVNHIVRHTQNKGLAASFADGIHYCLQMGADIIVNTDADNQYPQKDIPRLIEPILKGTAEIVIADRQTDKIKHFSPLKKFLQRLGSKVVRKLSGSSVPDAVSGFRAYSRDAALQLNVVTEFSYVIETIIQAQYKRIAVASVKVHTNAPTRESRLFKSMFEHIRHSSATMIRIYTMYRPLHVFVIIGAALCFLGSISGLRYVFFVFAGHGSGHIQSLIFSAILIVVGFQTVVTGLVGDLIGINRRLLEIILRKIRIIEYGQRRNERIGRKNFEILKTRKKRIYPSRVLN